MRTYTSALLALLVTTAACSSQTSTSDPVLSPKVATPAVSVPNVDDEPPQPVTPEPGDDDSGYGSDTPRPTDEAIDPQIGGDTSLDVARNEPGDTASADDVSVDGPGGTHNHIDEIIEPTVVSVGTQHRCWLVGAGFTCAGSNYRGELGVDIELPPLAEIGAGESRTCARTVDGEVWCWGWGLGEHRGSSVDDAIEPVLIPLPGVAVKLGVGIGHECAAVTHPDGGEAIYCWGHGYQSPTGYDQRFFAASYEPVEMWRGDHQHGIELGFQYGRAHLCDHVGSCGWRAWGVVAGQVVNKP